MKRTISFLSAVLPDSCADLALHGVGSGLALLPRCAGLPGGDCLRLVSPAERGRGEQFTGAMTTGDTSYLASDRRKCSSISPGPVMTHSCTDVQQYSAAVTVWALSQFGSERENLGMVLYCE